MTTFTKERYEAISDEYEAINDALENFVYAFIAEFCMSGEHECAYYIANDMITIKTETYYRGCDTEYDSYCFPISYLWNDDWKQAERDKRAEEKRLAEERKKTANEKSAAASKEYRRKQYLKLAEEFGE